MNKYFNPNTKETEELFNTLNPVYTVSYENPTIGNKGESVHITLEAEDENIAKVKAMNNEEFTSYINGKHFHRKYLNAFKPTGLYVIGEVRYYEGDQRL